MMGVQWKEHCTDKSILNQLGMNQVPMAKVAHATFVYFEECSCWGAGFDGDGGSDIGYQNDRFC